MGPIAAQFSAPFKPALLTTLTSTIHARLYPTSKQRPSRVPTQWVVSLSSNTCAICLACPWYFAQISQRIPRVSRHYHSQGSLLNDPTFHPTLGRFTRTAFLTTPVWRKCGGRKSTCFRSIMLCFLPTPPHLKCLAVWAVAMSWWIRHTFSRDGYSIADSGVRVRYQFKFTVSK